jgi:hypothetical protein
MTPTFEFAHKPCYKVNPCTTQWSLDMTNQSNRPYAVPPDVTRLERGSEFRTNALGEITAKQVGSFGQGYTLAALRAMEGYKNDGPFGYFGAKPVPTQIRGGRLTADVVMPRGGQWVKQEPPAMFTDGVPVTMYPGRIVPRWYTDANPL